MPPLRLYNTLTRRKEIFEPLEPERVRVYSCGPTVYSRQHVGNLRAFRDLAPRWPAPAARLVNAAAAAGGHVRTILWGLKGDHPARGLLSSVPMTQDKKPNRTTVRLPATLRYGFLRMVPAA
jgi:hypothetical protein